MRTLVAVCSLLLSTHLFASELDQVTTAPEVVIVKVNTETGAEEIFQTSDIQIDKEMMNDIEAKKVIDEVTVVENKLGNYDSVSKIEELDGDSSTGAWYFYTYGNFYYWKRWYTGYYNYRYSYFRWGNHYRYNYAYYYNYRYYNYYFYWY